MRNKILSLLVLLLTAAMGAWADEATVYTTQVSTATLKVGDILADGFSLTGGEKDNIILDGGRYKMDDILQSNQSDKLSVLHLSYKNYSFAYSIGGFYVFTPIDKKGLDGNAWVVTKINTNTETGLDIYLSGFNTIEVTPGATAGTWTFEMPAYDVEIAPIYAPAAKWATDGNLVLTPAAIEGIFAESTDAIVAAGTVAKGQGTVMYAVTSTNQATAPELSAFSATVPTAEKITAAGDVLVWYYIQGADTPQGQTATAENTFNDSEICETPIKVTVLSNKFDITFNAANANTIEAGKATVTVGGAAATVTEGKLEGVKMGSEVKMTAKQGYKFKKVEVKKAAVGPVTYTELKGGEVLHAGDILDFSDANVKYLFKGYNLLPSNSPFTVLRANITGDPDFPTVTPADDGAYYVIQDKNGDYYFTYDLPATATSDGILITIESEDGNYKNGTISVHEP